MPLKSNTFSLKMPDDSSDAIPSNVIGIGTSRNTLLESSAQDDIASIMSRNTPISYSGIGVGNTQSSGSYTPSLYKGSQLADNMPSNSNRSTIDKPPTSGNIAGGWVGAIFDMVNQVIGGVESIGEFFGWDDNSKTQKAQFAQSMKETTRRFDQTFFENVRQFNLEYALKEFATRKGIELQFAQQLWNQWIQGKTTDSQLKTESLAREKFKFDLDREKELYAKKLQFGKVFAKSFGNMIRGK
jgi:hypothetical protein